MLSTPRTASTLSRRVAALSLPVLLLGCGASSAADESGAANGGGGSGGAQAYSGPSITFVEASVLLVPGDPEARELTIETLPPAARTVRLSLVGESGDAFLDKSEITTGADGIGSVWLTAPTSPATFIVRASLEEGAHAELTASTGENFGIILVVPTYEGLRSVTEWTATVGTGRTCGTDVPPSDGELVVVAPDGAPLRVESVPVGVPLTVTARAGHFAGGCVDIEGVVAYGINTVPITIFDRPLQMGLASFDVRLGIDETLDWRTAFDPVIESMLSALVGDAPSDVSRVLDEMGVVIAETNGAAPANAFDTSRTDGTWDAQLTDALGANASDGLRGAVREQLTSSLERLAGPDVISASLVASATSFERATLDISTVAGIPSTVAGFPTSVAATWGATSATDTVRIGAELTWSPSELLAALADAQNDTNEGGAAAVVAAQFGCATLAQKLTSLGTAGLAYSTCDEACVTGSCEAAVRSLWEAARTAQTSGTLEIAAGGTVRIDDEAVPIGFDGDWVGQGTVGLDQPISFAGPATGGDPGN